MKKAIKEKSNNELASLKKNTRPFTTKKAGYKEEVYNNEQQASYNKSKDAKQNKKNTAAPRS